MRPEAFAYVAAGAGSEETLRANRAAFERWRIVPRMLRDVSGRDTGAELLGRRLESPFLLAPIGVLELAHRQADLAVARAARAAGVPMIFSSQASTPMEACAEALGDSPRWLQLYWSSSDELVESFVSRAEACGCEAIAVTLDTTVLGWRPRDLEPAFLPFLRGKGIAQYTSDPVFRRLASEGAAPDGPQPAPPVGPAHPLPGQAGVRPRAQRRAALRRGLLAPFPHLGRPPVPPRADEPADPAQGHRASGRRQARRRGRHRRHRGVQPRRPSGGRVDRHARCAAGRGRGVGGRIPILLDSGVRGGADAFKALALGATAVLIGRSYVYGLALAGEAGVLEVIENLKADFDLTMALTRLQLGGGDRPDCLVDAGARTWAIPAGAGGPMLRRDFARLREGVAHDACSSRLSLPLSDSRAGTT